MSLVRRASTLLVLVLLCSASHRIASAQLIPLLPPLESEPAEEPTPQESKAARMLQADLEAGRFADLDDVAQRFRESKARLAGGGWRLRQFYTQLNGGLNSEEAVARHIALLERWIAAKPESITPRIAMAETLHHWAWMARGSGVASTVTDQGWKLMEERIAREHEVLEAAGKLAPMCPQWYSEMMSLAIAEGWDRKRMQDMFEQGTKFEPGYLYLYKQYADYLLPKWYGKQGDATAFARVEADRVGGEDGDLIYYQVATTVIKRGNGGIPRDEMDWQRIKRGASILAKRYRSTRTSTNQLAFMAYTYRDREVAGPLFAAIDERWAAGVWKDKKYYDRARKWAENGIAEEKSPATPLVSE